MTGSATPNWSTRLRSTSTACDSAPDVSTVPVTALVSPLAALATSALVSISTRNATPPFKSRPSLILPEASRCNRFRMNVVGSVSFVALNKKYF